MKKNLLLLLLMVTFISCRDRSYSSICDSSNVIEPAGIEGVYKDYAFDSPREIKVTKLPTKGTYLILREMNLKSQAQVCKIAGKTLISYKEIGSELPDVYHIRELRLLPNTMVITQDLLFSEKKLNQLGIPYVLRDLGYGTNPPTIIKIVTSFDTSPDKLFKAIDWGQGEYWNSADTYIRDI